LKELGYISPRRSEEIAGSHWGICIYSAPSLEDMLERAAYLGVKWARISAHSTSFESEKGEHQWSYFEEEVNGLMKRQIQPFVTVSGGQALTDGSIQPPTASAEAMKSWLTFVEALVGQFRDRVRHWEIWNEPNHPTYWKPKSAPEAYAELVKKTSKTIRSVDPKAKIVAGALSGVDIPFAEGLFARGVAPYIDKFTYHPYHAFPEACIEPMRDWTVQGGALSSYLVRDLQSLVLNQERPISLWQGECGYPSTEHSLGWRDPWGGPWGERIQAKWLLRRSLLDISVGVEVSTYFTLVDYRDKDITNTKGLLRFGSWQPKPAYFSYQNLTSLVDNRLAPVKVPTEFRILDHGDFYGARPETIHFTSFSSLDGQKLFFYWLPWRAQENVGQARLALRLKNAGFNDPVLVDLLDGVVYEISYVKEEESTHFPELPLADYPLAVVSRDSVEVTSSRIFG